MKQIRPAKPSEFERLQHIDSSAGQAFAAFGMPEVAEDAPPTIGMFESYLDRDALWVYVDQLDRAIAFIMLDVVDGDLHIAQVSVHPEHAGHGYGARLIEAARSHALAAGYASLTLTTFRDVPWNAPYYKRLGFIEMPAQALGPELEAIRNHERERGLDRWPRVCMCRTLQTDT